MGVLPSKSIFMDLWDFEEGPKMGKNVVTNHEQKIPDG